MEKINILKYLTIHNIAETIIGVIIGSTRLHSHSQWHKSQKQESSTLPVKYIRYIHNSVLL